MPTPHQPVIVQSRRTPVEPSEAAWENGLNLPECDEIKAEAHTESMLCFCRALGTRGKLEYSPWAILDTQLPAVSPTMSTHGVARVSSYQRALLHSSLPQPEPAAMTEK